MRPRRVETAGNLHNRRGGEFEGGRERWSVSTTTRTKRENKKKIEIKNQVNACCWILAERDELMLKI